ncbi:MAG: zinc ribbon domain-containing protein [Acidobacteria bacterium]|nr:zinc ribbon domain-containing protein [Acidobacteriota bacterium]
MIPIAAWVIAGLVFLLLFMMMNWFFFQEAHPPFPWNVVLPAFVPLIAGAYVVLIGYVYGDARRRNMRYVMWTMLAIFVPNAIGIILYFILRDPMPVYCSRCGAAMRNGFAFCPACGNNVLPACPSCGKLLQPGWTHCAWCGVQVGTK